MRILHVIDTLEFGGAEKVLVALANAGVAAGHEVGVCCLRRAGVLAGELDPQIEVFSMNKGDGDDPMLPLRLGRRIAGQFDVMHTHNWSTFIEGGLATLTARIPVRVHTVHGPYAAEASQARLPRWKRRARHAVERVVAHRFQHIVAVSNAIRDYIPGTVGIAAARLSTIHNGIAGLPSGEPASHPGTRRGVTFVSVGRLDAVKNHSMMLRAFARTVARHPQARLLIVGDGPARDHLQAQARDLGLVNSIRFDGFRSDIAAVLAEADVFLLSSRYEGISIALLEAMRAGLPVVATRVGGIPETVMDERTGLLAPDDDHDAFAHSMCRLATDASSRLRMGAAARDFQLAEFSLDRMVQRYDALYLGAA